MAAPDRKTQIERTKTGILVLVFGALLAWVPFVGLFGGALTLIGAVLVILGRDAFGAVHRRNVLVSVVLFFAGVLIVVVGGLLAVALGVGGIANAPNEAELAAAIYGIFTNIVFFAAVGAFVSGLGSVFFTHALQKREGQLVLWAAYAATIGVQFASLFVALPALALVARSLAEAKFAGGTIDAAGIASAVGAAVFVVQLFAVIPAILYAIANILAWTRIDRGEIPEPTPAAPTTNPA